MQIQNAYFNGSLLNYMQILRDVSFRIREQKKSLWDNSAKHNEIGRPDIDRQWQTKNARITNKYEEAC